MGQGVIDGFARDVGPMGPRGSAGTLANLQFQLRVRERVRDKLPRIKPLADHVTYQFRRYIRHYSRRLLRSLDQR